MTALVVKSSQTHTTIVTVLYTTVFDSLLIHRVRPLIDLNENGFRTGPGCDCFTCFVSNEIDR